MKLSQAILMIVTSVMAFGASAHVGHDHSAISASAVHVVFYFSAIVSVIMVGYMAFKTFNKKTDD